MDFINEMLEEIARMLSNIEGMDLRFDNIHENLSRLFNNVGYLQEDITDAIELSTGFYFDILDRLAVIHYMGVALVILVVIILINNFGQNAKIKLLIQKVDELEGKKHGRKLNGNSSKGSPGNVD